MTRTRPRRRWNLLIVVIASLLVWASVERFGGPRYTLEPQYTDHLRHEYSAWAFLHIGFDVYRTSLEQWSVAGQHVDLEWEEVPTLYPPGLLLAFLPFGVVSNTGLLPDERVHMLMVALLGAAAAVAALQFFRTLRLTYEATLGSVLAILGTVLFMTWGLNGFIDPAAAGLALAGVYWSERRLYGRSLVALSVALSLHFRLWYLWPFVIALALCHRREVRFWQFGASAVLAAASLIAFGLAAPSVSDLHDAPEFEPNRLAVTDSVGIEEAVAVGAAILVLAVVSASERRPITAVCVALAFVVIFAVEQWQAWYPILLTPMLVLVRTRWAQVALSLAFLEVAFYLGGFPNAVRFVHLYLDAVR